MILPFGEESIHPVEDSHLKIRPVERPINRKDKIIAYSSIAIGVLGFSVFLYFYLTPLIKAHRKSKSRKRREQLLQPFSESRQRLVGGDDDDTENDRCSTFSASISIESKEPITPGRIVPRDSVGLTRARQAASVDLDPFLEKFPIPPPFQANSVSSTSPRQPFCGRNTPRDMTRLLTPPRSAQVNASQTGSPFSASSLSQTESPSTTFIISDSQDSIHSVHSVYTLQAQADPSIQSLSVYSSPSRSINRICGMVPPRSSSLNTLLSSSALAASTSSRSAIVSIEDSLQSAQKPKPASPNNKSTTYPVYAEVILPRYLRESCRVPYVQTQIEERHIKHQTHSKTPSIAISDSPTIQSLHVQDSVLARASSYTRGLVGVGTSPTKAKKSRGQGGTDLQFEMINHGPSAPTAPLRL
ncbi:uncharacterized protein FOMMEDRAFT_32039 [Fomitiporia mediterranea MF3/22]|uniref:uncharacterized protein n=1 Tax=Fomitiporia mediterranea (strain MF3/22) TaxID=694068 RepID=UPI0004409C45|nr:uncharacterized protein FOMMEDRAFT_32039 [Fomitiporia mediterranea MF3/22]EJC98303.1 hypothetical protein FOMMEDRAFT_32039 [Fomitiporia mediterranea MF3/22]